MATITAQRAAQNPATADELWVAYRRAALHKIGITLLRALNDPLLSHQLNLQAIAHRNASAKQHAKQSTEQEAA